MRIYVNQLAQHIGNNNALKPVYLVLGDEPLQKMQTVDAIRQACAAQGFDERVSLVQDQSFRWSDLHCAGQNLSLFSNRQLIELELNSLKPGQDGSKAFSAFLEQQSPDIILLITGPKAASDTQKAKWFKKLEQAGLFIAITQPEGQHFITWLKQAVARKSLIFEADALSQFGLMFEGNLLAADQELEKLSLQLGQQIIDVKALKQRVTNQARYNLFELQDAFIGGQSDKALMILAKLQMEAFEPQLLFWAFNREIELLLQLSQAKMNRQPLSKVYQQARVWQSRQVIFDQALQRLPLAKLMACSGLLGEIEQQIKCDFVTPWHLFSQLIIELTGAQ